MTKILGKIKSVKLRDIFPKEDKNFTKWLAKDESLEELGEAIGMNFQLEGTEIKVGSFFADIVCKNKNDKSRVVIENQLEKTDHTHLGQIITYASGLNALTMIWIASEFTEEHRKALKWLNKNTADEFQFFGLEVEALRIGESLPAPKFNVVCHPTDWRKPKYGKKQKKIKKDLTPLEVLKKSYWQGLKKYMADQGSKLTGQTPGPWQEQYFKIGRADTGIIVRLHIRENKIRIEIKFFAKKSSKAFFNLLYKDKSTIEREFGPPLDWQEFPEKGHSTIGFDIDYTNANININIKDKKDWIVQYGYIKNVVEKFDKVFTHRIRDINLDDWKPTAKK